MRVTCEISDIKLYGGEDGDLAIPSISATCSRCGHETESYGTDLPSVRRCLVVMRDECPEGENNYYRAV